MEKLPLKLPEIGKVYPSAKTRMHLDCGAFSIHFEVVGKLNKKQRRSILLAVYSKLHESLEPVSRRSYIKHDDSCSILSIQQMQRPISKRQACSIFSIEGRIGLAIRLTRLEFGLTQKDFAKKVGIHRISLSKIERQKTIPRRNCLLRILKKINELKNEINSERRALGKEEANIGLQERVFFEYMH